MINLNKQLRKHSKWTKFQLENNRLALVGKKAKVKLTVHDVEADGHYLTGIYLPLFGDKQQFVCHVSNSWWLDNVSKGDKLTLSGTIVNITDELHVVEMKNCQVL